ncbi:BlaI/MecI/CopY family transcriptional regulator [Flavivirga rizhaonensis]|uniref:BlaI/MecI/CopY family transcriptional regulator n=1 Tax=Flavivirga rizhaonensis TaxID=2559571 RepID=A0A4S1DZF4_9FLAO|nr:BlaI/MecI/CopY family transcriptional regulator [Flavivirga rizhaonensis]TGV03405.1 BlaI/MecI/CopY family transcriptional regulator [Flavivirga rizhaonensis]
MQLPKAEEQVMKYLWKINKAFMKDLLNEYPEPKPASTTISTLIKRLSKKGFIGYKTIGKSREYFPKVKKSGYSSYQIKELIKGLFNESTSQFASFFTRTTDFSEEELNQLKDILDKQLKSKK